MIMASTTKSDEREEGEIVDDDLEAISDISISAVDNNCCGKSVSTNGHLPALYLSEISDEPKSSPPRRQPPARRKCVRKRKSRIHKPLLDSDSDSDNFGLDPRLKRQLKAAVRVERSDNNHNNSLRTRLRAMTRVSNTSTDEKDGDKSVSENVDSNDQEESELIRLRQEALKTTFLNKSKCRKRKNLQDNGYIVGHTNGLTDPIIISDENVDINENSNKRLRTEENFDTNNTIEDNSIEDDEDILRAKLLASMTKKITKVEEKLVKQPLTTRTNVSENIIEKNKIYNNIVQTHRFQKVKPLLIPINGDSDSEDDTLRTEQKKSEIKVSNAKLENSVETFLKNERAKVEALSSAVLTPKHMNINNKSIIQKSSVKLLPKERQIEYQKLLMKLENAKKGKVRRVSAKIGHKPATSFPNNQKKVVGSRVLINKRAEINKPETASDISNDLKLFHKTFKEMQVSQNGKLRIQKKYDGLKAIIRKINDVSVERQKYDKEIKRILEELSENKKKLQATYQIFVKHVKELVFEKEKIDKSVNKFVNKPELSITSVPRKISAPVKKIVIPNNLKKLETNENKENGVKKIDKKIEVIIHNVPKEPIDEIKDKPSEYHVAEHSNSNKDEPVDDTISKLLVDIAEVGSDEIAEPNDVTDLMLNDKLNRKSIVMSNIIVEETKTNIPKYVSPLVPVSRITIDDPFAIMCPYDIDGNCCDSECIYKHYK